MLDHEQVGKFKNSLFKIVNKGELPESQSSGQRLGAFTPGTNKNIQNK